MTYTLTAAPINHMNPLDVHGLYKLRVDVFVHEQQCPYAEIDDTDALDSTVHILAFDDDTRGIVGTARVFPSTLDGEEVAQFGRFALDKQARCQMRVLGTGVPETRYCRVPGSWYRGRGAGGGPAGWVFSAG
ncbi:GNAT family N-acetyltransferase, partial [Corynebacterium striatum]